MRFSTMKTALLMCLFFAGRGIAVSVIAALVFVVPASAQTGSSGTFPGQIVHDDSVKPQMLWVQSAASMSYADGTLMLRGVPSTLYFSDRPYRLYGHMDNQSFASDVVQGQQVDPPNAALSVLGNDMVCVVELLGKPMLLDDGMTVVWKVRVLSGLLPEKAGAASLFIDTMVQPQITD